MSAAEEKADAAAHTGDGRQTGAQVTAYQLAQQAAKAAPVARSGPERSVTPPPPRTTALPEELRRQFAGIGIGRIEQ